MIRTSDDTAEARDRLRQVFDLSEVQATYILDMQLRRLTRLSRLEVERERDELVETIAALTAILDDDALLRRTVSSELADVAKAHSTPRRTVLLESVGLPVAASASPLEVADDPCHVLLSSTGLVARTTERRPAPDRRSTGRTRRGGLRGDDDGSRRDRAGDDGGTGRSPLGRRPPGTAADRVGAVPGGRCSAG